MLRRDDIRRKQKPKERKKEDADAEWKGDADAESQDDADTKLFDDTDDDWQDDNDAVSQDDANETDSKNPKSGKAVKVKTITRIIIRMMSIGRGSFLRGRSYLAVLYLISGKMLRFDFYFLGITDVGGTEVLSHRGIGVIIRTAYK
jgi:hypothetical protein